MDLQESKNQNCQLKLRSSLSFFIVLSARRFERNQRKNVPFSLRADKKRRWSKDRETENCWSASPYKVLATLPGANDRVAHPDEIGFSERMAPQNANRCRDRPRMRWKLRRKIDDSDSSISITEFIRPPQFVHFDK